MILCQLCQKIEASVTSSSTHSAVVDMLKLSSATALDMIGSAALGHDFDALGAESDYSKIVKLFSQVPSRSYFSFN